MTLKMRDNTELDGEPLKKPKSIKEIGDIEKQKQIFLEKEKRIAIERERLANKSKKLIAEGKQATL